MARGSWEQGPLEPPVKLLRSAGQATHTMLPVPTTASLGGLKVPLPCCQCLGPRDPGGGDFSRRGLGAGTWLAMCSEQEKAWPQTVIPRKVLLKPARHVLELLVCLGTTSLCPDRQESKAVHQSSRRSPVSICITPSPSPEGLGHPWLCCPKNLLWQPPLTKGVCAGVGARLDGKKGVITAQLCLQARWGGSF